MSTTPSPATDIIQAARFIHDEPQWRRPFALDRLAKGQCKAVVSRWRAENKGVREVTIESNDFHHTIAIALRHMDVAFFVAGRAIHDGRVLAGMLQASAPGEKLSARFRGAYDVLHLHLSQTFVTECLEQTKEYPNSGAGSLADACFARDPVIERLAQSLLLVEEADAQLSELYAENISFAIVSRLLGLRARASLQPVGRRVAALPSWRVKRVIDYVEAHLGGPITLRELAEATGLTRMHFAAQFRMAMGYRPHEYLLRKRIERARVQLLTSDAPLVDVALSVGFQTQAHFTMVFKRFTGETPHQWRCARLVRVDHECRLPTGGTDSEPLPGPRAN